MTQPTLLQRVIAGADLCRLEGDSDIAALLDEVAAALARPDRSEMIEKTIEDAADFIAARREEVIQSEAVGGDTGTLPDEARQLVEDAIDLELRLEAVVDHVLAQSATPAARDVLAERRRQVEVKGRSAERDDHYAGSELAVAAGCYAIWGETLPRSRPPTLWPFHRDWWKPTTRRRNLVKAAALLLAEIERIDRAAAPEVK